MSYVLQDILFFLTKGQRNFSHMNWDMKSCKVPFGGSRLGDTSLHLTPIVISRIKSCSYGK
uniref:Uncharacterized protein n=1 Tax=Rhizophagus irregularis (strain DAOM 181602 / DAOM 197198 / MUCL 43194) TaxID=747089 RepID=U9SVW5_RHIID